MSEKINYCANCVMMCRELPLVMADVAVGYCNICGEYGQIAVFINKKEAAELHIPLIKTGD